MVLQVGELRLFQMSVVNKIFRQLLVTNVALLLNQFWLCGCVNKGSAIRWAKFYLKEASLGDRKSKCQIIVEEKSIRFRLPPNPFSLDPNQVSSLRKVRYDANILKCERAHANNSRKSKVGIEATRLTGTELEK